MNHVFVSYSRVDGEWVEALVARLAGHGVDVWIDRRDLPVSLPWLDEVKDAIQESLLFLTCDSPAARTSAACAAEAADAQFLEKPSVTVSVAGTVNEAMELVLSRLWSLPDSRAIHTELVVRARDWDRAGRPRRLLATWRVRKHLRQGLIWLGPEVLPTAYLDASRRRSRYRAAMSLVGAFIVLGALLAPGELKDVEQRYADSNAAQARTIQEFRETALVAARDPYAALRAAADRGTDESGLNAAVISAAVATPVPLDAFDVPSGAVGFAARPVGDRVEIVDQTGALWSRDAEGRDQQLVPSVATDHESTGPESPFTVRTGGSGIVRVFKDGILYRTVALSGPPTTVAVSPDNRELVAAVGATAQVVDIETAEVRLTMRGAPAAVTDVAWTHDGRRVWATAGTKVVAWQRNYGQVLVDEPSQAFRALLPARDPMHAWLLRGDGLLRKVELDSGRDIMSIRIEERVLFAVASPGADAAFVVGLEHFWFVPLHEGATPERVLVEDCDVPWRPAWSPEADRVYLPCFNGRLVEGPLVELDPDGRETRRVTVPSPGVAAVGAIPGSPEVFVGAADGSLYRLHGDSLSSPLIELRCGAAARTIAVSEQAVLPVGDGTGLGACSYVGLRGGEGLQWNSYFDDLPQANTALSAAFSSTGTTFAVGYADGSIVIHPTENLLPTITDTTLHGAVRDLMMAADGSLYAVTQAGIMARVEFCDGCLSNRHLAGVAQRRLDRAIALGLA